MKLDTLPKLLVEKAELYGENRGAIREKEFGIWQEVTWQGYLDHVRFFALGLKSLGFEREDKIAIIGDNRPEWIYAELAAQALGGCSVGIYQDSLPKEVIYVINHADAVYLIVEDQEQVDKILEVKEEIPNVRKVIYFDPKGMRSYQDSLLMFFPDVQELGKAYARENPDFFMESVNKGSGGDIAIISYTSGTTGFPKGAVLTHDNLISMGQHLLDLDPLDERDQMMSFLPLAWIGEQMMSFAEALTAGMTVNFPEEPETVNENIREIGPRVMFSPPRIWEDMLAKVQVMIEDTSRLKKYLYKKLMPVGYQMADCRFKKEKPGFWLRIKYFFSEMLIFSAVKDHLGLFHLKYAYTGGAALGPEVFRFYHALGVNLKQIYGQTEVSGIAVVHRSDNIKFHTVGKPIPDTEVKISEDGEILLKSPSVFKGYYKNEEATAKTLVDGWLHTGDAGYLDEDGHLVVIDRVKDVIKMADGEIFSPQFIENSLKFSMYIKEAIVIGKNKPYVVGLINIDMANVGKWAENNQIAYTTYTDLSQKPEVLELVYKEMERVNKNLPPAAQVKKFVILHKELDADDEELTRTKKVRRGYVEEKYQQLIAELYNNAAEISVEGNVKYRDGREALIKTSLKVMQMTEVA